MMVGVRYDDLASAVGERFPQLAPALRDQQKEWAPDLVGGDIVLADHFVPFFLSAVADLPASAAVVADASAFIEELAWSDENSLRNAALISVLQALEDHPDEPWERTLGSAARSLLPTREHGG